MTGKTKKTILLIVTVLILALAAVAYYMYNKGPVDVKGSTGKKVTAIELYRTFSTDSSTAKKQYLDKILEVSGQVTKLSQNQQNQAVVLLKTPAAGAYVNCTLEGPVNGVKEGDDIIIKGICSGIGEGDAEMGIAGDVYLVRCYLIK